MAMFNRFSAFVEALSSASAYSRLMSLSDRELAARGLSRDGLSRSYISSLGAR